MLVNTKIQCPYCGEMYSTVVDASAGSQAYIEDCQICCRPIEFQITVGMDGALDGLVVRRDDD